MYSQGKQERLKPLKWYKDLVNLKDRLEAGVFLIEGERAIDQIISNFPEEVIEIISTKKMGSRYSSYPTRIVSESHLLSISSTKTPQGTIAVVRLPVDTYSDKLPQKIGSKLLLLEDIQDPGNVGTLIRTAAAFDFSGLILTEKCADPFSPKCIQATAGTLLSLWIRRTKVYLELVDKLKNKDYALIATDLKGVDNTAILRECKRFILALGNESAGLSKDIIGKADGRLRIPINRKKAESLNVAISGAICMYLSSQH